jgi:hypothetical protein
LFECCTFGLVAGTKHHGGACLYKYPHTALTDSLANTGYNRDFVVVPHVVILLDAPKNC